jgi:ankyrin repeat protein
MQFTIKLKKYFIKFLMLSLFASCSLGPTKVGGYPIDYYFDDPQMIEFGEAIAKGRAKKIRELAEKGLDVNFLGNDDMTPLMLALGAQQKESLRVLLELNADPTFVSPNREVNVVSIAAGASDSEFLEILLEGGGNPDQVDHLGRPALSIAAMNNQLKNLELLIEAGADINSTDKSNTTAALNAALINQFEAVVFLLENGADPKIVSDTSGTVALYVQENNVTKAQEEWRDKTKELLIEQGISFPVPRPWEDN